MNGVAILHKFESRGSLYAHPCQCYQLIVAYDFLGPRSCKCLLNSAVYMITLQPKKQFQVRGTSLRACYIRIAESGPPVLPTARRQRVNRCTWTRSHGRRPASLGAHVGQIDTNSLSACSLSPDPIPKVATQHYMSSNSTVRRKYGSMRQV